MAHGLNGLHDRLLRCNQASSSIASSHDLVRRSCSQHDGHLGKALSVTRLDYQRSSKRCRFTPRAEYNGGLQEDFGRQPSQPTAPPTFIKAPGKIIAGLLATFSASLADVKFSFNFSCNAKLNLHETPVFPSGSCAELLACLLSESNSAF